jgi:hypothetical protein
MQAALFFDALSATATFGAFSAAAYQLRRTRSEARELRQMELNSVAVVTEVVQRPARADRHDGRSTWTYRFSVDNPGRLPIVDVQVQIDFAIPVRRLHYNGVEDEPSITLEMGVPVIASHGNASWERTLTIDHESRQALRDTRGTVTFSLVSGGQRTNRWPR